MSRVLTALCAACAALLAAPASAGDFAPGASAGALARGFALPALGQPDVLAAGRSETRLTFDLSNEYVAEGDCAAECILLDGETARLRVAWRRGLRGGWDVALEAPLMSHGGGALDGWIQDWHGWFGLPNGGREHRANGQYRYYYARNGQVLLDESETGSGIGDLTASIGRRLGQARVARAMVKVPTGDESAPGGGNGGAALWLEQGLGAPAGWHGYLAIGGSINERAEVLGGKQNRELAFGGFGLMAPLGRKLFATAQLHVHGPLYEDSALAPLSRTGMPLTLGLQLRTGARGSVELGIQEDPSVNASPDFAVYLSFRSM
jgi:hypothetical protein